MKLVLEINEQYVTDADKEGIIAGGRIMITPAIGDADYWKYRVKLSRTQSIIGFPKFGCIGIGFMKEKNWNKNLPSDCDADELYNHIKENKGRSKISDEDCITAIQMIKDAVEKV